MLDYTMALYCAFDPTQPNQAGMIVFGQDIRLAIPLDLYSRDDWEAQVNTVRADPLACCTCCTPTAEAFQLAQQTFATSGKNPTQIAFVVTDGVPSNNDVGGNPAWRYVSRQLGYNPAEYNYQDVASAALALKATGVRVFLVGVPDVNGIPPDMNFFRGIIDPSKRNPSKPTAKLDQCLSRDGKLWCWPMKSSLFPIVTTPISHNSFSSDTFDTSTLIGDTVGALCELQPTVSPIIQPTIQPISMSPSSQSPTTNPTRPVMTQVDLNFLLDQSESMNWHADACIEVLNNQSYSGPSAPSPCWLLFTDYVVKQSIAASNIMGGLNMDQPLGWGADSPPGSVPARGVRVNIWGFSCRASQKIPVTTNFGLLIDNLDALKAAMQIASQVRPYGGTCPGQAIEAAVRAVEDADPTYYPLQAAIIVTDGVFYDMPFPQRATTGLAAYKVARFSVGIAVPIGVEQFGLTKQEIRLQAKHLSMFAGEQSHVFSLNALGFTFLQAVAESIAVELPLAFFKGDPIPRYTWCGWRMIPQCAAADWRYGHCFWLPPAASPIKQWGCRLIPGMGR